MGMAFLDDAGNQIQWEGLDVSPAPEEPICFCVEYPDPDVSNSEYASGSGSTVPGPSDASNMTSTAGYALHGSTLEPEGNASILKSSISVSPTAAPAMDASTTPESGSCHIPSFKRLTCDDCGSISAKTPRDFKRHLATAKHRKNAIRNGRERTLLEASAGPSTSTGFRCPVLLCDKTFPRKDNLWRHIAKMHGISDRGA